MRDVTIDEVFTWHEEFGQKAREAFGGSYCDVNPQTYSELKQRCDRLERAADPFFERLSPPVPLNGVHIHCVTDRMIPDGILRGCQCRTTERTYSNGCPILEVSQ